MKFQGEHLQKRMAKKEPKESQPQMGRSFPSSLKRSRRSPIPLRDRERGIFPLEGNLGGKKDGQRQVLHLKVINMINFICSALRCLSSLEQ